MALRKGLINEWLCLALRLLQIVAVNNIERIPYYVYTFILIQ